MKPDFSVSLQEVSVGSVSVAMDMIMLVVLVLLVGFLATKSRSFVCSLILSFYPTILIFGYTPSEWIDHISDTGVLVDLGVFIAIYAVIVMAVHGVLSDYFTQNISGSFVEGLLLGVALATLLFTAFFHIIPISEVFNFSNIFIQIFQPENFIVFQLAAPLVIFYIALNV